MPPVWWNEIREQADRPPATPRVALAIDGHEVGSVAAPLLAALCRADLPLTVAPGGTRATVRGAGSAALREIADWLRANGHAGRWRDELLAVRAAGRGPALAVVERGVARNLGLATWAVQLHARDPDQGGWWLQQRALDKATDPGRWDTVTGGLVAAGESVAQALERESWEEAGVRLAALATPPCDAGRFTVRRPVADSGTHGFMVETVHAFACSLDAGQVPVNRDGEVLRFDTFCDGRIDALVADGALTLEAAVAVALCRGVRA